MPAIYAMADVCVLPSIWNDPAPLAVIESLVSGKPLITTRSGGIPEYADGQSAIILERDGKLQKQLVRAMIELAENIEDFKSIMDNNSLRTQLSKEEYNAQLFNQITNTTASSLKD